MTASNKQAKANKSIGTSIQVSLSPYDDQNFGMLLKMEHEFDVDIASDSKFRIFATRDTVLRDAIPAGYNSPAAGYNSPLFDTWFIAGSRETFEESVDSMLRTMVIALTYRDEYDNELSTQPQVCALREIKAGSWAETLDWFGKGDGPTPKQDIAERFDSLRIFECDLARLLPNTHEHKALRGISFSSSTLQRIDHGYCFWYVAYPSFVKKVVLDATAISALPDNNLLFDTVLFNSRLSSSSQGWSKGTKPFEFDIDAWFLAGQGGALAWKTSGQLMPDTAMQVTPEAIDESSVSMIVKSFRRAWRQRNFDKIRCLIRDFGRLREELVPDWMPAMRAYRLSDWKPGDALAYRNVDPRSLITQLGS